MEEVATSGGPARVSQEQRQVMLAFMRDNPALATGRFLTPDGVKHKARLLADLTERLNCIEGGCTKVPEKWFKCWQDWKCDTKKKASKIRRYAAGTGGGLPCKMQLTDLEEQVISLMGPVAVTGHSVVDPLDEVLTAQLLAIASNVVSDVAAMDVTFTMPVGQWVDLDPNDDVNGAESFSPAPELSVSPLNRSSPTTIVQSSTPSPTARLSSSRPSSGSERSKASGSKRTFRSASESCAVGSSDVRAALLNAEAMAKQADVQAKRLALEQENFSLRQSQAKEDMELKRMTAEAAVRMANSMASMADAVSAAMQALEKFVTR